MGLLVWARAHPLPIFFFSKFLLASPLTTVMSTLNDINFCDPAQERVVQGQSFIALDDRFVVCHFSIHQQIAVLPEQSRNNWLYLIDTHTMRDKVYTGGTRPKVDISGWEKEFPSCKFHTPPADDYEGNRVYPGMDREVFKPIKCYLRTKNGVPPLRPGESTPRFPKPPWLTGCVIFLPYPDGRYREFVMWVGSRFYRVAVDPLAKPLGSGPIPGPLSLA